jgi:isoquinoline 1-oxidoreductase beta subunit
MQDSQGPARRGASPRSGLRRLFLASGALAVGGLVVGASFAGFRAWRLARYKPASAEGRHSFNAWIGIDRQGTVSVFVPHQEMGQGIHTLLALLVAEEMDCDPARVVAVAAPLSAAYSNPVPLLDALGVDESGGRLRSTTQRAFGSMLRLFGEQVTGGSSSVRNCWEATRHAAAAARAMLITAAAVRWGVPADRLRCIGSRVVDPVGNRYVGFGELATEAALIEPAASKPKPRDQYRLVGRGIPRLDSRAKSDGSAKFACDIRLPDQSFASVRHAPQVGVKLMKASWPSAGAPAGASLVSGDDWFAVVARSWWLADKFAESVVADWSAPAVPALSSESYLVELRQRTEAPGVRSVFRRQESDDRKPAVRKTFEARYEVPFLAHQTMEPMNCTIRLGTDRCEVWTGTQAPGLVQRAVARVVGLSNESVVVHPQLMGTGLGRRLEIDVVRQAAQIATALPRGQAVQLLWRREEDTRRDMFRPAAVARLQAGLGARGELVRLECTLASASVLTQYTSRLMGVNLTRLPDRTTHDGLSDLAYDIDDVEVRFDHAPTSIPVGYWRAVGYGVNTFFLESFIDECAHAAGDDPYQFRRRLLQRQPRPLRVLEEASRLSGWGRPVQSRRGSKGGRGIALSSCYGSIAAQVIEVEVDGSEVRVLRALTVVDCGLAIDRGGVRSQIAGSIVMALSAALHGQIDIRDARVIQGNYSDARVLSLRESPRIQVEMIDGASNPGGVGELGVPAVAPALANAVFAATGKRIRRLPLKIS